MFDILCLADFNEIHNSNMQKILLDAFYCLQEFR